MPPRPRLQLLQHHQRAHYHSQTPPPAQLPPCPYRSLLRPPTFGLLKRLPYRQQCRSKSSNMDGPTQHAPGRHEEGKGFHRFPDLPFAGDQLLREQSAGTRNLQSVKESLPNDLGLLLGTLVMPAAKKLPRYTSHPIRRVRMEFQRLFLRAKDLISVLSFKYSLSPSIKIYPRRTAPTAAALHRQMYTALANGNITPLMPNLAEGIAHTLSSRVASRSPGTRYLWTLHRYLSNPRVVSHRAAMLPVDDGSGKKLGVRQAVVQIRSIQSLRKVDSVGNVTTAKRSPYLAHAPDTTSTPGLGRIEGAATVAAKGRGRRQNEVAGKAADGQEREVTEYIVIQRRIYHGKEGVWKIWGMVNETRLNEWEAVINPDVSGIADAGVRGV